MSKSYKTIRPGKQGLYDPSNEHDACGIGFVANIKGTISHSIVDNGLEMLENLEHRGAVGADKSVGDGAGILSRIPDAFFRNEFNKKKISLPVFSNYGVGMFFLPRNKIFALYFINYFLLILLRSSSVCTSTKFDFITPKYVLKFLSKTVLYFNNLSAPF